MKKIQEIVNRTRVSRQKENKPKTKVVEEENTSEEDFSSESKGEVEVFLTVQEKLTCKTPKWITDIDTSDHITNQLSLFRGLLRRIKGMTINLVNLRLYVWETGCAQIRTKEKAMILSNVLYVSDLGVSLLSGFSLYKFKFFDSFNKKTLYMRD